MARAEARPLSLTRLSAWIDRLKRRRADAPAPVSIKAAAAPADLPRLPQAQGGPIQSEGVVVRDYEVAHLYPGAVRRTVTALSLLKAGGPAEVTLAAFEARQVALATPFYLPIDLQNARLFANQTYEHVFTFWSGEPRITDGAYAYSSGPPKVVARKAVVIGGPVDLNYYHWMLNWLSRLAILKMLRPDLYDDPEVALIVDERARRAPFIDFLEASGIDPSRFIWTPGDGELFVEHAVLVSFGNRDETCPAVGATLRDLFAPMGTPPPGGRRRLWISRQALGPHRRRVANMDEITPVLAAHGFEEVALEGMAVADQIGLFQVAEAVVGVHGAGLTNMIFSPPDCRVLSIESDLNLKFATDKFYSTLARACGHPFALLKVRRVPRDQASDHTFASAHTQDYIVKPDALDAALSEFLAPLRPHRPPP